MSDPPRLSKDTRSLAATLIKTARHDRVPSTARQRALVALGLASATATGGAGATAAGGGTAVAVTIAKWVTVGATLAALGVGARTYARHTAVPLASPHAIETAIAPPAQSTEPAQASEPAPTARAAEPAQASGPAVQARSRPHALGSTKAADVPTNLAREVASLDDAREALRAGDPARTLGSLDRYQREFPSGLLSLESMVLRIEAVAELGDRTETERLARQFLAANPGSAHVGRVRSLLRSAAAPPVP